MTWTIVAAAVAVAALLALAVVSLRLAAVARSAAGASAALAGERSRADGLARELESSSAAGDLARREAIEARGRAEAAEGRASVALARTGGVEARVREQRSLVGAVWALERRRRGRAWVTVAGPVGGEAPDTGDDVLAGLASIVGFELDIIREEVGTPGRFAGASPPTGRADVPEPGVALVGALLVTELLQALARRSEGLEVQIEPADGATVVTVAAEGWDGGEGPDAALVADLALAGRDAGVGVEVLAPAGGEVRAKLILPAVAPEGARPAQPPQPKWSSGP